MLSKLSLATAFALLLAATPSFAERPTQTVFGAYINHDGSTVFLFDDLDNGKIDQVYLWYTPSNFQVDMNRFDYEMNGTSARIDMSYLLQVPDAVQSEAVAIKAMAAQRYGRDPSQVFILPMVLWDAAFAPSPIAKRLFDTELTPPEDSFDIAAPIRFFGKLGATSRQIFNYLAKRELAFGTVEGTLNFYSDAGKLTPQPYTSSLDLRAIPSCKISPNGC